MDLNRPNDDSSNPDYFLCLYAFGDKDDGTGFVRARDCPGQGHSEPEDEPNAKWEIIEEGSHQYKIKNTEIEMCLGEEVTKVISQCLRANSNHFLGQSRPTGIARAS